jgi:hypothetical protein
MAASTPVGMYQAIKSLSYDLFYERSLLYAKDNLFPQKLSICCSMDDAKDMFNMML